MTAVYQPHGTNYLPNISYHANGMFSQINHSNGVSDSQSIAYGMMRPTRLKTLGNTGFSTGQISYDGAGNITGMGSSKFAYDGVSRLVESEQHFSDGTWRNTNFSYDPYGNLTGRSGTDQTGSFSESFPVDSATNHLQGETYNYHGAQETRYDGDGNMSTTQWIDWDKYFEEVASVSGGGLNENYTYDADGERVIAGTWASGYRYFLRDLDGKVLSEFELSGNQMVWKKDYIYRGSQMAAVEDADDGLMYFHLDQLGTPRLITDANGVTVATHDYAPFGFEVSNAQADGVTKKFTGHEGDGGDNPGTKYDLDYMHARYYSAWESRFLSVDPAQADPKNPQSWNRYAYVLGNPLKYVDPFGLIEWDPKRGSWKTTDEFTVIGEEPDWYRNLMKQREIERDYRETQSYKERTRICYLDHSREMLRVAGGGVPAQGLPSDPILEHGVVAVSVIFPVPKKFTVFPSTIAVNLEMKKEGLSVSADWGPGSGAGVAGGAGLEFGRSIEDRSALAISLTGGGDLGGGVSVSNFGGMGKQTFRMFGALGYGAGLNFGVANLYSRTFSIWD